MAASNYLWYNEKLPFMNGSTELDQAPNFRRILTPQEKLQRKNKDYQKNEIK